MHRIVIVGGGAGGLELATRLGDKLGKSKRAHITLVDRCPTHVWKPLLHEVAAGSLDAHAHQIEYAAQAHWHHFEFVRGEMVGLERASQFLRLAPMFDTEGDNEEILPARCIEYDTLVLALGSQTHFFGVPGAQSNAIPLDTLAQAERLRRRLLQTCVKKAALNASGTQAAVHVAIIGGGATGVELSAELRKMEKAFRQFGLHASGRDSDINVTLLEAGPRILPALSTTVAEATTELLKKIGIEVSVADPVTEVGRHDVFTKNGRIIPADITIWAAGIKAPDVLASLDGIAVNRINQIKVSRSLQSETDPNVFAFGDCASCSWKEDRVVPPRAQAAHQQATFLAKALRARVEGRPLGGFSYIDHGSLVSLGSSSAVGNLMGGGVGRNLLVEGLVAKVMYAALYRKHLASVSGFRRTLVDLVVHGLRRAAMPRVKLH
ncbi:NAD(P)/FAD-dependent oxidoreductase [Paraburkholderia dipogonis]|uniref:NAD(P)/FAD-dependent oxidoreductase n=1 Tax=Paraburkholderia dipogonis TaxID=1211383 RepID=A0A4Y8MRF4_9BURK|nr:NAD(P)/FAD-dependent oxidoreductase [Paraburkholderia dipogonis]TFE40024.1 NAD(P)/FAD-dependent oxidoreductase [Paraburkholderia dipogonis]